MSGSVADSALRPAALAALLLAGFLLLNTFFLLHGRALRAEQREALPRLHIAVAALGLTDLVVATEARYTRHPAVSDPLTPFMSHPGAIEHFPTGSFWAPPPLLRQAQPSSAAERLRPVLSTVGGPDERLRAVLPQVPPQREESP